MKQFEKLQNTLRGLTAAITRFPLTAAFLVAAAVINACDIQIENSNYSKYLLTLAVGAFLGAVAQAAYERFFRKASSRAVLSVAAALLTLGYYLIIMPAPKLSMEIGIRTSVALFALLIAFIWIPAIKSRTSFNESFMVTFKAFFIALFFSGVIFAGTSIIMAAIDQLLFEVDSKAYSHAASMIFILYAPIYFLALIPVYPGRRDEDETQEVVGTNRERIERAASCPKYLEILISYIIIPLTAVFTVILALYIVLNVGSEFWTDNLLEPMIVAYSITVILVYILASRLENNFAVWFRRIFPKVLVPIVIFQTISSVIRIGDTGITHTRYYVIIFGLFAIASGIIFSIVPVRKNGIIAAVLIVLSAISIVPPTDAFTISRVNQINILEAVLIKNNMLEGGSIKPNTALSEIDRQKIIGSMDYFNMMDYIDRLPWLPANFNYYSDFYKTFGFYQYEQGEQTTRFINVGLDRSTLIEIKGYDAFVLTSINISGKNEINENIGTLKKSGKSYTLTKHITNGECSIDLIDENSQKLLSFPTREVFRKFESFGSEKNVISLDEAAFAKENERAAITLVIQSLNMELPVEKMSGSEYYGAELYILVSIKDL